MNEQRGNAHSVDTLHCSPRCKKQQQVEEPVLLSASTLIAFHSTALASHTRKLGCGCASVKRTSFSHIRIFSIFHFFHTFVLHRKYPFTILCTHTHSVLFPHTTSSIRRKNKTERSTIQPPPQARPADVIPPPPTVLIRPGGGLEGGRGRGRGAEMSRQMSGVTLLLRNIILPDKHCSWLM